LLGRSCRVPDLSASVVAPMGHVRRRFGGGHGDWSSDQVEGTENDMELEPLAFCLPA